MTGGRFRGFFWMGVALVAVGLLAAAGELSPGLGDWAAAAAGLVALAGLALHEHAYVQAGQSVPLA
jgi:hypothetical protein